MQSTLHQYIQFLVACQVPRPGFGQIPGKNEARS